MKHTKLFQLLALNRSAPRHYEVVKAKAGAEGEAEIFLYDTIGYDWWNDSGVTAKQFRADLRALGDKTLNLRINSPGGDVMEGRAMAAALAEYPGKVIVHVEGLAASAASFLAMHGDEVVMTEGAFVMIHNGWTVTIGDRHDHIDQAGLLAKVDGAIVNDYLLRAKVDADQLSAWMDKETWFTAQEALDAGLVDRIAESRSERAQARASAWNLAVFEHAPKALREPVGPAAPTPAPATPTPNNGHEARLRALALAETEPA
jgi:ATP-dependent Clp protease protease subunit